MKSNEVLLLIVDMQVDFCSPDGALYIPGAEKDVKRLVDFLARRGEEIDHIILTRDVHQKMDISHPGFWKDKNGNHPMPYTPITFKDVNEGVWIPANDTDQVLEYIKTLEQQEEFPHIIWNEHCLVDTDGVEFVPEMMKAVDKWTKSGRSYEVITKGDHQLTEHFGVIRANVPNENAPETQVNRRLLETLKSYQKIYVAGEARSHCVANTIKQILELEEIGDSFILLEDCMSNVPGFEKLAAPIYEMAMKRGVRFANSKSMNC